MWIAHGRVAARGTFAAVTALSLALLTGSPAPAGASGSGYFTPAPSMPDLGGSCPAAASLSDGRVLVAGGVYFQDRLGSTSDAQTEIFASRTGWTLGPTMSARRGCAAAAPLPGDRVLIAGGIDEISPFVGPSVGPLASTEIYDARNNSFSPGPPLSKPRVGAMAAPLRGGGVLVAGGDQGGTAEVLDPGTNTFHPVGSMNGPRSDGAASPLPDGRVLIVGGQESSSEIYNPATATFSTGRSVNGRIGTMAAPLPDGRVLIAGGRVGTAPSREAQVFKPRSGRFSSKGIGQLISGRSFGAAATLGDGRVLVVGGAGDYLGDSSAEVFVASNRFKARLVGTELIVHVHSTGKLKVRGPGLAKVQRKGGPGRIKLPLRLARQSNGLIRALITFKPVGGVARSKSKRLAPG